MQNVSFIEGGSVNKSQKVAVLWIVVMIQSQSVRAVEPTGIKQVMQELGRNMQTVTDGISHEDWGLVEEISSKIASRHQPPLSEKLRIIGLLGLEMERFKSLDGETHRAAIALERASRERDGRKVISVFQQLQMGCLACHEAYRDRFVRHFSGN